MADAIEELQAQTAKLVKRSRRSYYEVLAAAYRVYLGIARWPQAEQAAVLTDLSQRLKSAGKGPKVKSHDARRLLLHALIDYGVDEKTVNKAVSRDGRAIEYAEASKIAPDAFVEKITAKDGGLERWARAMSGIGSRRAKRDHKVAPNRDAQVEDLEERLPLRLIETEKLTTVLRRTGYYVGVFRFDSAENQVDFLNAQFWQRQKPGDKRIERCMDELLRTICEANMRKV